MWAGVSVRGGRGGESGVNDVARWLRMDCATGCTGWNSAFNIVKLQPRQRSVGGLAGREGQSHDCWLLILAFDPGILANTRLCCSLWVGHEEDLAGGAWQVDMAAAAVSAPVSTLCLAVAAAGNKCLWGGSSSMRQCNLLCARLHVSPGTHPPTPHLDAAVNPHAHVGQVSVDPGHCACTHNAPARDAHLREQCGRTENMQRGHGGMGLRSWMAATCDFASKDRPATM